jgi:hypothetical protein
VSGLGSIHLVVLVSRVCGDPMSRAAHGHGTCWRGSMQITFLYWYDNPNAVRLPYLLAALDAVLGGKSPAILATQTAGT